MKIINVLCVGCGVPRRLRNESQHDHLAAIAEIISAPLNGFRNDKVWCYRRRMLRFVPQPAQPAPTYMSPSQ